MSSEQTHFLFSSLSNSLIAELSLELSCSSNNFCSARIKVPVSIITSLYNEVSLSQQKHIHTKGFISGNVPLEYIKQNFKKNIIEHIKEFLFRFCIIDFLYSELRKQKIIIAGEPKLLVVSLELDQDAYFLFEFTKYSDLIINEWKYFSFKSPSRKKYQDLDRQVDFFIKTEQEFLINHKEETLVPGDWVNFNIALNNTATNDLLLGLKQNFWFRLGNEKLESPLQDIFIGKKVGDIFSTDNKGFQDFFSNQLTSHYSFRIEIVDMLSSAYFCLDQFKHHFKLKTNKDVHKKLIEVFSYRDDLSQRRSMVEESFKLLLSKHQFTIPSYLTLRQQKILLEKISHNPDYNVYRKEKNFMTHVQNLAEKQVRESIFIDGFAYQENIDITHDDVKNYFNLMNRQRTKEFIYFQTPLSTIHGQEMPIQTEEIKRICLREKAINYAIYHLTKK